MVEYHTAEVSPLLFTVIITLKRQAHILGVYYVCAVWVLQRGMQLP